jgi:hypothetical protein
MKPGKLHSALAETGRGVVFGKQCETLQSFTDFSLGRFSVIRLHAKVPIDFIRCQIETNAFGSRGLNFHKTLAAF